MTSLPYRRLVRPALLAVLVLVLASCAADAPQDALDPASDIARRLHGLYTNVFYVAVAVFILVQGLIVYSIVKFRRKDDDEEWPEQSHGNTRLEVGWTILPAVVLAVVAAFTVPVIFALDAEPDDPITVEVTGQQFWWGFTYPDHGGFETANELHIPTGRDVFLQMTSPDVVHSFWAPRLNGKRDVVPNRVHTWTIHAEAPGAYSGQCAEFCGTSHANMRLKVVAHDPADFEAWVENQNTEPEAPTDGDAADGFALFETAGCAGCHVVRGQWEQPGEDAVPAPDLTHLYTRDCFAGCIYDLNDRNEMAAWLRNPQRKDGSLMVIGELAEADINSLIAYLETLR